MLSAITGSIRVKTKMDITRPPLMDILVKYVFELRRACPNYWREKINQHTVTLMKDLIFQNEGYIPKKAQLSDMRTELKFKYFEFLNF